MKDRSSEQIPLIESWH